MSLTKQQLLEALHKAKRKRWESIPAICPVETAQKAVEVFNPIKAWLDELPDDIPVCQPNPDIDVSQAKECKHEWTDKGLGAYCRKCELSIHDIVKEKVSETKEPVSSGCEAYPELSKWEWEREFEKRFGVAKCFKNHSMDSDLRAGATGKEIKSFISNLLASKDKDAEWALREQEHGFEIKLKAIRDEIIKDATANDWHYQKTANENLIDTVNHVFAKHLGK